MVLVLFFFLLLVVFLVSVVRRTEQLGVTRSCQAYSLILLIIIRKSLFRRFQVKLKARNKILKVYLFRYIYLHIHRSFRMSAIDVSMGASHPMVSCFLTICERFLLVCWFGLVWFCFVFLMVSVSCKEKLDED